MRLPAGLQIRHMALAAGIFSLPGCAQLAGIVDSNVAAAIHGAQFPSDQTPPGVASTDTAYKTNLTLLGTAMTVSQEAPSDTQKAIAYYQQGLLVGKMNCRTYIDGMSIADRTLDTGQFTISLLSTITNGVLGAVGAGVAAYNGLNIGTNAAQSTVHFASSEFTFDVGQDNIDQLITKNMQNAAEVSAGTQGANIKTYQDAYSALLDGMDACRLTQIKYALAAAVQKAAPTGTQPPGQPAPLSLTASNDIAANKMTLAGTDGSATGSTKLTINDMQDDQVVISTVPLSAAYDPGGGAMPLAAGNTSFTIKGPISSATYTLKFSSLTRGKNVSITAIGSKAGAIQSAVATIGTQ
jgi:hypothetical protein